MTTVHKWWGGIPKRPAIYVMYGAGTPPWPGHACRVVADKTSAARPSSGARSAVDSQFGYRPCGPSRVLLRQIVVDDDVPSDYGRSREQRE
jgi:hypothetical protein